MAKTGAPKGAQNYVLCERCSAVKEKRRRRMCSACSDSYVREQRKEYALLRYSSDPTKQQAANRRWMRKKKYPAPTRPMPIACEICGKQDFDQRREGPRTLALDHCHKTGIFRGWLCFKCNTGLGRFGDTLEGLGSAYNYLLFAYKEPGE